jgi:Luciferase-like monooxygenase
VGFAASLRLCSLFLLHFDRDAAPPAGSDRLIGSPEGWSDERLFRSIQLSAKPQNWACPGRPTIRVGPVDQAVTRATRSAEIAIQANGRNGSMKFGIHNPSWVYGPDPTQAFDALKAKAQWAENHGFVWLSVMDHLIQIPGVGAPDEPFMEGWTVLSALAAVTSRIRLATLATSVGYRNPAHLAKIAASVDLISGGRLDTRHRGRLF